MGVMEALLISFILGLGLTLIKNDTLKLAIKDFSEIVTKLVGGVVIPLLPFHVYGIFAKLTYAGTIVELMTSFINVFAVILCLHGGHPGVPVHRWPAPRPRRIPSA